MKPAPVNRCGLLPRPPSRYGWAVIIEQAYAIPDLLSARNVLCVQPHYDDNDIGAGGTIARLKQLGARITYLTVTDDLVGVLDDSLSDEEAARALQRDQLAAGELIGVDEQILLGYPDAGKYDYFDLRRDLIEHIRRIRPDFVLTCDPWLPYEFHHDHVLGGRAAADAVCLQAGVRRLPTRPDVDAAYEKYDVTAIALYWTRAANTVVDITAQRQIKHQAIDCYKTQLSAEECAFLHGVLDHKERGWAAGQAFSHGEALKVLRPVHLHCNVDAAGM